MESNTLWAGSVPRPLGPEKNLTESTLDAPCFIRRYFWDLGPKSLVGSGRASRSLVGYLGIRMGVALLGGLQ